MLHGVLFRRCSTPSKYVPQLRPLPINLSLHSSALVAGPMPDMAALTSLCFHCWAWSCMSLATALVHYSAGPPLSCLHPPAWQTQPARSQLFSLLSLGPNTGLINCLSSYLCDYDISGVQQQIAGWLSSVLQKPAPVPWQQPYSPPSPPRDYCRHGYTSMLSTYLCISCSALQPAAQWVLFQVQGQGARGEATPKCNRLLQRWPRMVKKHKISSGSL